MLDNISEKAVKQAEFKRIVNEVNDNFTITPEDFKNLITGHQLQMTAFDLSQLTGYSESKCYKMFQGRLPIPGWLIYCLHETFKFHPSIKVKGVDDD